MSKNNHRELFTADSKFTTTEGKDGSPGTVNGYAIVFGTKSSDRGGFKVVIAPGAPRFQAPTFALANHDYTTPLGRTDNGSLTIHPADTYGVPVTIALPDTTAGRDTFANVKSGLVRGMSFGMLMKGAKFSTAKDATGDEVDTFTEFNVDEVTVTAIPAFTETTVGVARGEQQHQRAEGTEKFADGGFDAAAQHAEAARLERYRLDLYPPSLAEHQ